MSFKELFEYAQSLEIYIKRNAIRDRAADICGVGRINIVRSGLDIDKCRGYWLTPQNEDHPLVKQFGTHIVVVAREQNRCWERFVIVKELMHLFDTPQQKTSTPKAFTNLLSEFSAPMSVWSDQFHSEVDSFWQALAVLCPQNVRNEFREQRQQDKIGDLDIALKLKIPEAYVPRLFEERFDLWLSDNGCI